MMTSLLLMMPLCSLQRRRVSAPDSSDAIRQVVEDYIVGWGEGDSETLSRVFEHDHGYVIWVSTDESGAAKVDSKSSFPSGESRTSPMERNWWRSPS